MLTPEHVDGLCEVAASHFRPLGVQHDGNGVLVELVVLLDEVDDSLVGGVVPMGHVHASDIHALISQAPQLLPGVGRWPDGAYNLGLSELVPIRDCLQGPACCQGSAIPL